MARSFLPEAVTAADLIASCGGNIPPEPEIGEDITPLPEPEEGSAAAKPKKLPLWRKLLAGAAGLVAIVTFIKAISVTDLSTLLNSSGVTGAALDQIPIYIAFIAAMVVLAAAVSRKAPPTRLVQVSKDQRKLSKRTIAAAVMILLLIPLTIFVGAMFFGNRKYYFIALLIVIETMLPFALVFEGRKPQARELVIIAVLCAIGVAGRAAFFMLPNFKPVIGIVIIAAIAFGGETGFLVGAVTMMVSNMLFGQGPWTPWQMFSTGIIGFLAGILFRKGLLRRSRASMAIFGALVTVVIYGGIMNPASALMWVNDLSWKTLLTYYVSGFPVDLVHACATALTLWFLGEPMLEKLDRIKVKYGLVE